MNLFHDFQKSPNATLIIVVIPCYFQFIEFHLKTLLMYIELFISTDILFIYDYRIIFFHLKFSVDQKTSRTTYSKEKKILYIFYYITYEGLFVLLSVYQLLGPRFLLQSTIQSMRDEAPPEAADCCKHLFNFHILAKITKKFVLKTFFF